VCFKRTPAIGEANYNAKLNESKVRFIRATAYLDDARSIKLAAQRNGVTTKTIRNVLRRKFWKDV
jgi:transposase